MGCPVQVERIICQQEAASSLSSLICKTWGLAWNPAKVKTCFCGKAPRLWKLLPGFKSPLIPCPNPLPKPSPTARHQPSGSSLLVYTIGYMGACWTVALGLEVREEFRRVVGAHSCPCCYQGLTPPEQDSDQGQAQSPAQRFSKPSARREFRS